MSNSLLLFSTGTNSKPRHSVQCPTQGAAHIRGNPGVPSEHRTDVSWVLSDSQLFQNVGQERTREELQCSSVCKELWKGNKKKNKPKHHSRHFFSVFHFIIMFNTGSIKSLCLQLWSSPVAHPFTLLPSSDATGQGNRDTGDSNAKQRKARRERSVKGSV